MRVLENATTSLEVANYSRFGDFKCNWNIFGNLIYVDVVTTKTKLKFQNIFIALTKVLNIGT